MIENEKSCVYTPENALSCSIVKKTLILFCSFLAGSTIDAEEEEPVHTPAETPVRDWSVQATRACVLGLVLTAHARNRDQRLLAGSHCANAELGLFLWRWQNPRHKENDGNQKNEKLDFKASRGWGESV